MEKEISEDSYCTTDEENIEEENEQPHIEDTTDDIPGTISKIKKDNIIKEIIISGKGYKPSDIDTVIVSILTKYNNHVIEELTLNEKEFNLEEKILPKAIRVAIIEMRKKEKALIKISYNYIKRHYDNNKIDMPGLMKEEIKGEYVICEIMLHKFYTIQNLYDNGEIKKKILNYGNLWKYAKLSDYVTYSIKCFYDDKLLYQKINEKVEIDKANLYEIEQRIIQNLKPGETSDIVVKPVYMIAKNKQFLKDFSIFGGENEIKNVEFYAELHEIDSYEYIFKPNKDKLSKKKIIKKGFGKDSPDRESFAKIKLQISKDKVILYNDFLDLEESYDDYKNWRDEINKEYLSDRNLDDDNDFERDYIIFKKFEEKFNAHTIDLRIYSIPIILRKVIIHMKRNEIAYIKTNYIDYINLNNFELENASGDFEINIHLLEFLHRTSFSKMDLKEKLNDLIEMKELANTFFKNGKLFRACKIYQNINYRFNYGDVFGAMVDIEGAERKAEKEQPDIYKKLCEVRISCHSNLASAKLKINKFQSVYDICSKILIQFDNMHIKALFMKGKSCYKLNKFEEAVEIFTKLNEINKGNKEFMAELEHAKELYENDIRKKKNKFKKMLFSN